MSIQSILDYISIIPDLRQLRDYKVFKADLKRKKKRAALSFWYIEQVLAALRSERSSVREKKSDLT